MSKIYRGRNTVGEEYVYGFLLILRGKYYIVDKDEEPFEPCGSYGDAVNIESVISETVEEYKGEGD